ncbi:MAG: TatD family hydrolase [Deltaproteobacteria bacterium]|nr:TatD family hydrolase [Deltaproteobacteria bacterium]
MTLWDTHCHLHAPEYAGAHADLLARAREHGIQGIVAVGCDPATNRATLVLARQYPVMIRPALGLHPEWVHPPGAVPALAAQVRGHRPLVVAIGEVGLPWYRLGDGPVTEEGRRLAEGVLRACLRLAERADLPALLHAPHGAASRALELLREQGIARAVFHWHKASPEVTQAIVGAGYFVSVTPELLYRERDRELVRSVPLTALLVETDGPWPFAQAFGAQRTEPWMVERVVEAIAAVKGVPLPEVRAELAANLRRLFGPAVLGPEGC